MKSFVLWSLFILILIFNYSIKPQTLEDIEHISAVSYDYVDEHQIKGTASAPFYPPGQNVQPVPSFFTAVGRTILDIQQKQQMEAQRPLRVGRLNNFLISKELAQHGIKNLADPIGRSIAIGRDVHMAVVDGSAEELLTFPYPNAQNTAQYLSHFTAETLKDFIPEPTVHAFLSQYKAFGQDPFLPLLEKKHDHIHYKGLALFKDDRYVGSLSIRDSTLFRLLYQKTKGGLYEITLKDNTYVNIEDIRSKVKYKVSGPEDNPRITIQVSMLGQVREASSLLGLNKKSSIHKLEQEWKKEMTNRAEKMVKKLQSLGTDPLRIGEKVRSHYRNFDKTGWDERYRSLPIDFQMKVEIRSTGIVE
ncbi:Ger(x)C family spore germination protein [Bacillus sp. B190/17]|uniref:Ger(X)C family spore germination protein n=1 Tax=Bacillus lumedeiriae TaxID=3058829 RepID=A0ABW8IBX7_9BACI